MMQCIGGLAARLFAVCLLALGVTPAHAGLVQTIPLPYLQDVFTQRSVLDATDIGLYFKIQPTQTLYMPTTAVDLAGSSLHDLAVASGLQDTLSIPVFYIDSFSIAGVVGLGFMNDNGVALLTSFQETLIMHDAYRVYESCSWLPGSTCWYDVPAVTRTDVNLGWFRSATVLAHEIGHNLGLRHQSGGLMNGTIAPLSEARNPSSYLLTDDEVSLMLESPFVQTSSRGYKFIEIVPFNVLLESDDPARAVPEPATFLVAALGLLCLAVVQRRRHGG